MENQHTLNEQEIRQAIVDYLENVRGIPGIDHNCVTFDYPKISVVDQSPFEARVRYGVVEEETKPLECGNGACCSNNTFENFQYSCPARNKEALMCSLYPVGIHNNMECEESSCPLWYLKNI